MAIIKGTKGNDVLKATASGDQIYGLSGDDQLSVPRAEGNVSLNSVVLSGSAGDDALSFTGVGHTISGGAGDDRLSGVFFHDSTLRGGAGDDSFLAADSNSAGNVMQGGAGDDNFLFSFAHSMTASG